MDKFVEFFDGFMGMLWGVSHRLLYNFLFSRFVNYYFSLSFFIFSDFSWEPHTSIDKLPCHIWKSEWYREKLIHFVWFDDCFPRIFIWRKSIKERANNKLIEFINISTNVGEFSGHSIKFYLQAP